MQMLTGESRRVADRAKRLYEEELRQTLEASHLGAFVCIEPESGDYFLGQTFDDAVNKAIDAHPDRLTHTLRIGHTAAIHLGVMIQ
jgi:hypothetical protein